MKLYYRIKNRIEDFIYDFRCRCQRFKRGYAYGDVWDIDCWFKRTVKPMLTHLRDHGIGIPGDLYLDGAENERKVWEDSLTEMVDCLTLMDEDEAEKHLGIADNDYSFESYKRVQDFTEAKKNRFFELFSKWFFYLWD